MQHLTERQKQARTRKAIDQWFATMDAMTALVRQLHVEGFTDVFIESMLMTTAPWSGFVSVWIERAEISFEQMDRLREIADEYGARLSLGQPMSVNGPSRIRIWPRAEGE